MLTVRDLVKRYPIRGGAGELTALAGVDLELADGETLGVLGESGCGKSTLAKVLVQLERATSGSVSLDGVELTGLGGAALRRQRRRIQMVFQDPFSSLNPRSTIGDILGSVLAVHHLGGGRGGRAGRIAELLDIVGLDRSFATRYPHEMSGGQRQRVGIARALAVEPQVLILDEPVSALDVSVRAEIMNLLARLRRELGLSYIFISHDVAMVRHLADRVAVMYLGRIVEIGPWRAVVDNAAHPYTRALRAAVPVPDPAGRGRITAPVRGEVPNPADPPSGCPFHPRCPLVEEICREVDPVLEPVTADPTADPTVAAVEAGLPARPGGAGPGPGRRLAACHVVTR